MKQIKYLSLFSGIGGFELGIKQAYEDYNRLVIQRQEAENLQENQSDSTEQFRTANCIGYSEIDKYACQVYDKHFKHKNYGDITDIEPKSLPDFDLLVGGFPCQAFSIAGKRRGFNDTRGTLFFEVARIVREKQPRLLLLENVKGLLSHDKGNTFFTIISTLDELGYDCQWQVLNSKNFGVPQNRERVFIIGHLRGTSRPEVFPIGEGEKQTRGILQLNKPRHSNDRIYDTKGLSPTLNTMQGGDRQPIVTSTITTENAHGFGKNVTARQAFDIACEIGEVRRLTPTECMRLQGFPDSWCDVGADGKLISDCQKYKMAGNAVTTCVIKEIIKRLINKI